MTDIEKEREQIAEFCEVTGMNYGARGYFMAASALEFVADRIRNNTYRVPIADGTINTRFATVEIDR